jgi:GABA(A) receptor-associated protein
MTEIKNIDYDNETTNTYEKRRAEINAILIKYPDRIPILVYKQKKSNVPDISNHKYLVPNDLSMGQFMFIIRKRLKLSEDKALFFNSESFILPSGILMSAAYDKYKSPDGFLRIRYQGENTFG